MLNYAHISGYQNYAGIICQGWPKPAGEDEEHQKFIYPTLGGIRYTRKVVLYQVVVERESTPRCLQSPCMHAHKVTTPLQEIPQHEDFGHPHSHTIQPHNNQMCAITTTVIVSFRVWKFCGIRR